MDATDRPLLAAALLHDAAHGLRNDVSTLRMAARLVDDQDVVDSIRESLDDLQVQLERAIVAARIDLDERPASTVIEADELVRLATARARRERPQGPVHDVVVDAATLEVPGPWAERLVTDLLHGAERDWLDPLASACGLAVEDGADGRRTLRAVDAAR